MLIDATDITHAVELLKGGPILQIGGAVEMCPAQHVPTFGDACGRPDVHHPMAGLFQTEPSDLLFRPKPGRMAATLMRIFLQPHVGRGCRARCLVPRRGVWKFRGMPENPFAWLLATTKNRALDVMRRQRTASHFCS
jgi:hypothetical protein